MQRAREVNNHAQGIIKSAFYSQFLLWYCMIVSSFTNSCKLIGHKKAVYTFRIQKSVAGCTFDIYIYICHKNWLI